MRNAGQGKVRVDVVVSAAAAAVVTRWEQTLPFSFQS